MTRLWAFSASGRSAAAVLRARATTSWPCRRALGNRTAAEAWADGDVVLVRRFVEVHVSERFAEGLAARPEVMQQLFDAAQPS
ncbi:MAG: hypothetical protein ACYC1D_17790 [Acidimicrobiales bacterium]